MQEIDFGFPLYVFNGMEAVALAAVLTASSAIVAHSKAVAGTILTLGAAGLIMRNVMAIRTAMEQGRFAEDMLGTVALRVIISTIALIAAGWPTTCYLAWVPTAANRAQADSTRLLTGYNGPLPPRHVDIATMLSKTDFGRAVLNFARPQPKPFDTTLIDQQGGSKNFLYPLAVNGGFVVPALAVAAWDIMSWVIDRTLSHMHLTGFFTPDLVPPVLARNQFEAQDLLASLGKFYQNAPEVAHRLALADEGFASGFTLQLLKLRDMVYRLDGPDWTMGSPHTRDFERLLRGETINAQIAFGSYHFPEVVQGGNIRFYPGARKECSVPNPVDQIPYLYYDDPERVCFYYDIAMRDGYRTERQQNGALLRPVSASEIAHAFQVDPISDPPAARVVPSPYTLLARARKDLNEVRSKWNEYTRILQSRQTRETSPQLLDPTDPSSPTAQMITLMLTNGMELIYIADMMDPDKIGVRQPSIRMQDVLGTIPGFLARLGSINPRLQARYQRIYALATDPNRPAQGRWGAALCNALGVDPASEELVPHTLRILAKLLRHYGDIAVKNALRLMDYTYQEMRTISSMAGLRGNTGVATSTAAGVSGAVAGGGLAFVIKQGLLKVGHFLASAASRVSPVAMVVSITLAVLGLLAKLVLLVFYVGIVIRSSVAFVRLQFIGPVAAFAGTENVIWHSVVDILNGRLWTLFFVLAGFIAYVFSELFASAIPVISSAAGANLTYITHIGLGMMIVSKLSNIFSFAPVNPFFGQGGGGGEASGAGAGGGQSPTEYEATRRGGAVALTSAASAAAAPLGTKLASAMHGATLGLGEGLERAMSAAKKAQNAAQAAAQVEKAGEKAAESAKAAAGGGRAGFQLRPAGTPGDDKGAAESFGLRVIDGGLADAAKDAAASEGKKKIRRKRGSGKGGGEGGSAASAGERGASVQKPYLTSGDHGILGSMLEGAAKGWTHPDQPILVTAGRWAAMYSEFSPKDGGMRQGLLYKMNQAIFRSAAESAAKHRSWKLEKGDRQARTSRKEGEEY